MFVVLITYTKAAEEVEAARPAHRTFLDQCVRSGHLVVSGPRKDRKGGVILVKGGSLEEVKALFAKDPFQTEGVGSYEFLEFQPAKHAPGFELFLPTPQG